MFRSFYFLCSYFEVIKINFTAIPDNPLKFNPFPLISFKYENENLFFEKKRKNSFKLRSTQPTKNVKKVIGQHVLSQQIFLFNIDNRDLALNFLVQF